MPVGEQNPFDGDPGLIDCRQNAVDVATGVDDQGALRLLIPQDGAVLLKWGDRDDGAA
jgi:hypothetical protein